MAVTVVRQIVSGHSKIFVIFLDSDNGSNSIYDSAENNAGEQGSF